MLAGGKRAQKVLYLATSDEKGIIGPTRRLVEILEKGQFAGLRWRYAPMPEEKHSTIYHPAALRAFRYLFAPSSGNALVR